MEMLELDELCFSFFREFARCEYCLKATGFRKPGRDAMADWGAFSVEVRHLLDAPSSEPLTSAVAYYLAHPPRKQVIEGGVLAWDPVLPDHASQAELVLRLIGRVRNNLFHGGKFNDRFFDPQRSEDLLNHGLEILEACIKGHPKIYEAYLGRAPDS